MDRIKVYCKDLTDIIREVLSETPPMDLELPDFDMDDDG